MSQQTEKREVQRRQKNQITTTTNNKNNNNSINKKASGRFSTRKLTDKEVQEMPRRARRTPPLDDIADASKGGGGDAKPTTPKKLPLHTALEELHMKQTTQLGKNVEVANAVKVNANRRAAGSNWDTASQGAVYAASAPGQVPKSENQAPSNNQTAQASGEQKTLSKSARLRRKRKEAQLNKYVAMDCEMVGVGQNGQFDMLARVSIVNKQGEVLLDKFVKPREIVTDYRTCVSGIRPSDIAHGEDFNIVQDQVVELLQGKILVGHAIRNDLAVLHIKHPFNNIRDTSRYKPLSRLVANGRTPSLKRLTLAILGIEIQKGEHNSVEDARATMSIYNRLSADWERFLLKP